MPWNFPTLCIPMITDKLDSTMEILILHHLTWTVVKIQSKYMETFNDKYDIHHMSANQELFLFFVSSCEIIFFILVSLEHHWTMCMYQFTPCEK